jgi:type IV pilus assembly protein PilY1
MAGAIALNFSVIGRLLTVLLLTALVIPKAFAALNIAQTPLSIVPSALPIVMLNMPKDHQLYFKAFDDYSDLDGDGIPETTYKHSFNYYGYFDSYKCYDYVNNRFTPTTISINKYCSGQWSGNFLNWASMTRIDIIRKMLYGGLRSTDSAGDTELERSYLPNDAHSFAKFYQGDDLAQLTPFSADEGVTLCNTTFSNKAFSQDVTDPPLLRVAKGNYSLWAANERWQCLWVEDNRQAFDPTLNGGSGGLIPISNGNVPAESGIDAATGNPAKATDGLGEGDYIVRVKACVDDSLKGTENCKNYRNASTGTTTLKPVGLLQTYGDDGKMRLGLMTGSYGKNKSGGVLRKNATVLTDEVNVDSDGTFKPPPANGGIINTLDKLRIYGYRHNGGMANTDGTYNNSQPPSPGSDNCIWGLNSFSNGQCSNWGNPQSEIFLESLRYLAGKSATPAFVPLTNDSTRIEGLDNATVVDPIAENEYCAALNIVQFNAATSSYDADELSGVTDINASNVNTLTDTVGDGVGITGKQYFVGENGTDNNQLCTAKIVTALSKVRGVCPEEPRLSGSYQISGLAHHAHTTDIRPSDRTDKQRVTTYGLAVSQNKPKVVISVPNSAKKITLSPACLNVSINGNCAIVDFKIVSRTEPVTTGHETGKLYVNWEDSEQGGDFDQDMWGIISYDVSADKVAITTHVIAKSTDQVLGFGYVIGGTDNDGFHAHSGINGFNCLDCNVSDTATTGNYNIGASSAENLQDPLFYAVQWGGFVDGNDDSAPDQATEWDSVNNITGSPPGDGIPDKYFFSINPKQAETSLGKALAEITKTVSSSTSVVSNASAISAKTLLFQTQFDSSNWTGQVIVYSIREIGNTTIELRPIWNAGEKVTSQGPGERSIFGYNPTLSSKGIDFVYGNLSAAQQELLTEAQLNFIRGDQSSETPNGLFRARTDTITQTQTGTTSAGNRLLGDIVNSDPLYIGPSNNGYERLPTPEGNEYLNYIGSPAMLNRTPMLAVGANDGMLHVFNALSDPVAGGKELFAYVPNTVMGHLFALTSPSYTAPGQHQYFVDGSPAVGDAYFDTDNDNDKEWRTLLVGTLGAGGKGIFALDVTFLNTNDYNVAEPVFSTQRILWEINDQTAPTEADLHDDLASSPKKYGFANNLGYTLGQASVVRMANGQFAAIFGNGYNSIGQSAVLYVVDIKTGSLIRSIGTETSGDNGLSTPLAVDANKDSIIDAIYAGDLQGNFWKFDVSSNNPNEWGVAYIPNNVPTPLFTAKIASEPGQPITAKPLFATHPDKGILLYFGTGSYFQTGDNVIDNNTQTQSFYGIWDECINYAGTAGGCNNNPISGRAALVEQTIDMEIDMGNQFVVRKTSANQVTYPAQKGWYMDLLKPPAPGTAIGERVISEAILRNRRIIFTTNVPNSARCDTGGTGWLMELNPLSGSRLTETPFDITGDGNIDKNDQIIDAGKPIAVSGLQLGKGMVKKPAIIRSINPLEDKEFKFTGTRTVVEKGGGAAIGRQSWAQIR